MIHGLREFYARMDELEAELRERGHAAIADDIRDAATGGTTSGEILARSWPALARILREAPELTARTEALLKYAEKLIDAS